MSLTQSIPASNYVTINPGVLSAGGAGPSMSGLYLTTSTQVPIGTVVSFASALAVATYFGAGSLEAADAAIYFSGFTNKQQTPGALLFTQYPWAVSVPAYLRGGNISGLTLGQIQEITGTITLTIDGQSATSGALSGLSSATSFSNAASIIQTALGFYDAVVTASITTTNMTVSAVASGVLAPEQTVSGAGVTAGTTIVSQTSGSSGGAGVYVVSVSQSASSTTVSAGPALVTYDSVSGAFIITGGTPGSAGAITAARGSAAAPLLLTTATGAVTSQGANIATPAAFMTNLISVTQNFAAFATNFEPTPTDKIAFAQWNATQNDAYGYVYDSTEVALTTNSDSATSLYSIIQAGYGGTICNYQPSYLHTAAFVMGMIASINFGVPNGRITLAYKNSPSLAPGAFSQTVAANLEANGANYYGAVANASNAWNFYYPGQITGPYKWADSYVNQIWLNQSLQTAIVTLLTSVNSIPYDQPGYDLVSAACNDPIQAAVTAGVITPGVTLSALQAQEVNTAAGANISGTLSVRGWYLQVGPATAAQRAARQSPPCTLWYCDGGSIQRINLASIVVQ
jgi:hypothetical protein